MTVLIVGMNQTLTVQLDAAPATNQLPCTVSYQDQGGQGNQTVLTAGTTPVVLVQAPANSIDRFITGLRIPNLDTVQRIVTITLSIVGGVSAQQYRAILPPNYVINFDRSFYVLDPNGNICQTGTSSGVVTITGGTIDNTPIGSITPSNGVFTSLSSASGALNGTLGATTPAAGSFTTLNSTSGALNGTLGNSTPSSAVVTTETLTPQAAPGSPVNGQQWEDSGQNTLTSFDAGLKVWKSGTIFIGTTTATTSGTGASSIIPTGVGTTTIPANYFVPGKTLRIRAVGTVTTAATPGTITIQIALGTSTILSSGAGTMTASLTSTAASFDMWITCKTTGSGGTCLFNSLLGYVSTAQAYNVLLQPSSASVALNTTIANALTITTTNSVASGTVFTINSFTVEVMA